MNGLSREANLPVRWSRPTERQRLRPSTDTGSPLLAEGTIYITNEDGLTSVVQAVSLGRV